MVPGTTHTLETASSRLDAQAPQTSASTPWSTCLLAGLGLGYAAAIVTAQSRTAMRAEAGGATRGEKKFITGPVNSGVRTPVAYPIFTFRWLAVHALTVPGVFFIGAIVAMQFIQR